MRPTHSDSAEQRRAHLDEFCRENSGTLHRYLSTRLGNQLDVEDVAQEACLRLCRADATTRISNLQGFLFQIAKNLVADFYRRKSHAAKTLYLGNFDMEMEPDQDQISVEDAAIVTEELAIVGQAIGDLPKRCKQVFVRYRIGEYTQREISRDLGISRQMVERHVAKAVATCKRRVAEVAGP